MGQVIHGKVGRFGSRNFVTQWVKSLGVSRTTWIFPVTIPYCLRLHCECWKNISLVDCMHIFAIFVGLGWVTSDNFNVGRIGLGPLFGWSGQKSDPSNRLCNSTRVDEMQVKHKDSPRSSPNLYSYCMWANLRNDRQEPTTVTTQLTVSIKV